MKKIGTFLMLMIVTLSFYNCSSTKNVTNAQLEDKWTLKSINGINVYQAFKTTVPSLTFNFNIEQVSGNSGCNTFNGKFIYESGYFVAPNLATTQMACLDANDETAFLKILSERSKLTIINGDLIFMQSGKPVLIFSREDPLDSSNLAGVWHLETINGESIGKGFNANKPTIQFDFADGKISGNAGCNNYNASFNLNKNVISVMPVLTTTRMSCEQMEGEYKFVDLLKGTYDLDIENGLLVMRRDNRMVMTFTK